MAHDNADLHRRQRLRHLDALGRAHSQAHGVGVRLLAVGVISHEPVLAQDGGAALVHARIPVDACHVEGQRHAGSVGKRARDARGHGGGQGLGRVAGEHGDVGRGVDGGEGRVRRRVARRHHGERAGLGAHAHRGRVVCRVRPDGERRRLGVQVKRVVPQVDRVLRRSHLGHVGGAVLGLAAHGLVAQRRRLVPAHGRLQLRRGAPGQRGRGGKFLARLRGVEMDVHRGEAHRVHSGQVHVGARIGEGQHGVVDVLYRIGGVPQARGGGRVPEQERHALGGVVPAVDRRLGALVVLGAALPVDGHLVGRGVGHLVELLLGGDVLQVQLAAQVEEVAADDVVGELLGHEALRGHVRTQADARPRSHLVLAAVGGNVGIDALRHAASGQEQVVGSARGAGVAVDAHHAVQVDVVLVARVDAAALAVGGVADDRAVLDEVVASRVVHRAATGVVRGGLVAREGAARKRCIAAVEVDRAATAFGGVIREVAVLDPQVLAARVDGAAVAFAFVHDKGAVFDGDARRVGINGAAAAVKGLVVQETDAGDLAVGVVAGADGGTMLRAAAVGPYPCRPVADEVEVVVVEPDAAAAGGNGVLPDLGGVDHLDAGVLAVAVDAAAVPAQVPVNGAVVHVDGGVGSAQVDAAAVAAAAQTVFIAGVVGDLRALHVDGAVLAVGAHAAAVRPVGLVAHHGHVGEVEGRPLLHLDAAGRVVAVAPGDDAAGLDGLGFSGVKVGQDLDVETGEPIDAGAVEREGRVLVEPEDATAVGLRVIAINLVAVHLEGRGLPGGHAEGALLVPVGVHDDDLALVPGSPPGRVDVGVHRAVLGVGDLPAVGQGRGGQRERECRQGAHQHGDQRREQPAPPFHAAGRGDPPDGWQGHGRFSFLVETRVPVLGRHQVRPAIVLATRRHLVTLQAQIGM